MSTGTDQLIQRRKMKSTKTPASLNRPNGLFVLMSSPFVSCNLSTVQKKWRRFTFLLDTSAEYFKILEESKLTKITMPSPFILPT